MRILIVCGPTASGKSEIALNIAKVISRPTAIVNIDAMQVYKDIVNITASPSFEHKKLFPHYLYNYIELDKKYSIAIYIKHLRSILANLYKKNILPILVGGSGLYISSLLFGLSEIEEIKSEIRLETIEKIDKIGVENFYYILLEMDPSIKNIIDPNNKQRLTRAYEVITQTGKSIFSYEKKIPIKEIDPIIIYLKSQRELLYKKCNDRMSILLKNGGLDEIFSLYQKIYEKKIYSIEAKAIGIKEFFDYFKGKHSYKEALTKSQQKTRNYAKRQITWFSNQILNKDICKYIIDFNSENELKEKIRNLIDIIKISI